MQTKEFVLLCIINCIIVLLYILWNLLRKKEKKAGYWVKVMVMFFCPVAGPCFVFLSYFFMKILFSQIADLDDVVFSKERAETYLHADEERGRNLVSLEEALAITDKSSLRTLMMNVVRGDVHKSLSSIALALNSEDSETAHYAASVLQEALNDFRTQVQKTYGKLKEKKVNQEKTASELIYYMDDVLKQRVLTDMEQKSFVNIMDEVGEILYTHAKDQMDSNQFEAICLRLLEVKEYERCQLWCQRAMEQYPMTLSSYTCQLKLYFAEEEREKFMEVLELLKKSNIVINRETLEKIRVFK